MSKNTKPATYVIEDGKFLNGDSNSDSGCSDKGHDKGHNNKNDRHALMCCSGRR
jgi:hypothetical protein